MSTAHGLRNLIFFLQKSAADDFGLELHDKSSSNFRHLQSDRNVGGIDLLPVESTSRLAADEQRLSDVAASKFHQQLPAVDQPNDRELPFPGTEETSAENPANARTFDQLCLDADDVIERAEEIIQANQNCLIDDLCKVADDVIGRSEMVVKEAETYLACDLVARAAARDVESLCQVSTMAPGRANPDGAAGAEPRDEVDRNDHTSDEDFWCPPTVSPHDVRSRDDIDRNNSDDDDDDDDDFHDCKDSLEGPSKTGNVDSVDEGSADSDSSSDVSGFYPSHAHVVAASPMASLPSRSASFYSLHCRLAAVRQFLESLLSQTGAGFSNALVAP